MLKPKTWNPFAWLEWLLAFFPWWVVSLASNAAIIRTEYLNRTAPSFPAALVNTWPLILFAQACLFYSYNRAPSLLIAWVVFTTGNSAMRLIMARFFLDEPFRPAWALAAASLMIAGSYCIKMATTKG